MRRKQGVGNEVTDRARVQVKLVSHFSFPCPPLARSPLFVPRSSNIR